MISKPLQQFWVQEVPISHKYEMYYPDTLNILHVGISKSNNWIVLTEHFEFATTGFIFLDTNHWISIEAHVFNVYLPLTAPE